MENFMMNLNVTYPEIFFTGELKESDNERSLCADAFIGWANVMLCAKIPKNFGKGMAAISGKLGVPATIDSIEKYVIDKGFIKE